MSNGEIITQGGNESFLSVFKDVKSIFDKIVETKTNKNYVKLKQGFQYIEANYLESEFRKYFPIHTCKVINKTFVKDYWVTYDVEVTAYLTPTVRITETGAGGARLQIPADLTNAIKQGKDFWEVPDKSDPTGKNKIKLSVAASLSMLPLYYIDVGNDCKSALTKAKANAISKFGFGADIYKKVILSEEQIAEIDAEIKEIITKHIPDPLSVAKERARFAAEVKTPADRLRFLQDLRSKYDIVSPVTTDEDNDRPDTEEN